MQQKNSVIFTEFYVCVNTYFDTICVHQQKSATPCKIAYSLPQMSTLKLTDKLEFVMLLSIVIYLISVRVRELSYL